MEENNYKYYCYSCEK